MAIVGEKLSQGRTSAPQISTPTYSVEIGLSLIVKIV
jgi:hypothetical protein